MSTETARRVDFYILSEDTPRARALFACRLTEKAWRSGVRVFLLLGDHARQEELDQLLWSFRPGSFLPHGGADSDEPIRLGLQPPADTDLLLINLSPTMPENWADYTRLAEIIDTDPAVRAAGRERFRRYRDGGREPVSHKL
ncbi:DNA polymerase III subunit chi [Alkalilimnicola sp. S0819]|uniref:DNA polymerase III subunit chi n=1 Tax=Alkalilimnicola sp. S0819 TaxID=2613922 RepID=UPI00126212AB|nr:DNA polymerase III subunit chi [Alkalilimnicola sp. S0819]KAB7628337.1 DNA polymerase III subunit chi [Alkalilimnicola sp. S0819]MPQ15236.1 DNA polymerase III subunit chi [Alkalilimnicola sp. S0819]